VNLMQELQERLGLTYLFIAHDLSVVRHISHRIAVMYAGKIVEIGSRDEIYHDPKHPYTRALLSAVPIPDPKIESQRSRIVLQGRFPNLIDPPLGCRFQSRCPVAQERCVHEPPPLEPRAPGHDAACWYT
jgi:peptide/nickel transport system ATP-binding protein